VVVESVEQELLLACARWSLGIVRPSDVAIAATRVRNWPAFLRLADAQGVQALAAAAIESSDVPLPAEPMDVLRRTLRHNARRVHLLTQELLRVMALLDAAGVRAVALKGPVIAHLCYTEPACRSIGDLDLLVTRRDLRHASRVLSDAGYFEKGDAHLRSCRRAFGRLGNEIPFENTTTGIHIDLHGELMPVGFPATLNCREMIDRSKMIELEGQTVRSLASMDHLVFLCLHGAKHGWSGLNWVLDLCGFIRQLPDLPLHTARPSPVQRMTSIGLLLADYLLQGSNPQLENVCREALSDERMAASRFISRFGSIEGEAFTVRRSIGDLLVTSGSLCATARFVGMMIVVPQPSDWESVRILRPGLYFLYYPVRLARLGWMRALRISTIRQHGKLEDTNEAG
jgi:hypothetical protein